MELKVYDYNLPECVLFNYSELKQELQEKVKQYEVTVYTDDQIKLAKSDKANLNKLKKALNDERIRREREYMEPFNDFKAKINEIISIIDKPVKLIDQQVKAFEDKQKQDKHKAILDYFVNNNTHEFLALDMIFDNKWLNASTSMKSIHKDIDTKLEQITNDRAILAELPEFGFEAQEVYKTTLDINKAVCEAKRMSEIAKAKAKAEVETHVIECGATGSIKTEVIKEVKKEEVVKDLDGTVYVQDEDKQGFTAYEKPVEKQWVNFSALLSTEDALALKSFFESRNITFRAI